MSTEVSQLTVGPLTAHAFNGDHSQLAISCNSNEVQILSKAATGSWAPAINLTEHDKLVTSIDWAPRTNRIVTCSHDRNAYVWNLEPSPDTGELTWMPTLVLLRLNRSATAVRWSPNEEKFAVASGARAIAVCQYDEESNWWVAKHIKKPLRTTVLAIEWHPNSVLLASGSADGKARVFSAFIKGVDSKPEPTLWGEKLPFNTVCGEFSSAAGGWVHDVAFSPSGDVLAFVAHDSSITVVYPSGPELAPQAIYQLQLTSLPFMSLVFVSDRALVAAGHSCQPVLFTGDVGQGWVEGKSLDDVEKKGLLGGASKVAAGAVGRLNSAAFNTFRQADSRGASSSSSSAAVGAGTRVTASGGTELLTTHQNTITSVRAFEGDANGVSKVSTTGVDGRLVIWGV